MLINKKFSWNSSLEELNERMYNNNYLKCVLAAKDLDGLVAHEMAHFITFQECETWEDFLTAERNVRSNYLPGISKYNIVSKDGTETIAEAFLESSTERKYQSKRKHCFNNIFIKKK